MKKIYLTFDIEPLVNKRSFNPTIYNSMVIGGTFIAKELEKRNLNGTFYISLSRKTSALNRRGYEEGLDLLLRVLSSFKNISVQPHLHAFDLPVGFETKSDLFGDYNFNEQVAMLKWAKEKLTSYGYKVDSFRPGSYSKNDQYYAALEKAGYQYSSVLDTTNHNVNIDFIDKTWRDTKPEAIRDIIEFPVTSVKLKSIKGKTEVINLSPDFLTIESVAESIEKLNYINVNFHSFSVFTRKFLRENHKNIWFHNARYFLFDKPLNALLKAQNIETIAHNTVLQNEFIKWIEFISKRQYKTYFIGE